MIVLRWLLIASLFICSSYAKFTIDWTDCEKKATCFLLYECHDINLVANNGKISLFSNIETFRNIKTNLRCDVGLQLRFLNDNKLLYFIQIEKKVNAKIELLQGDDIILSCKKEANGQIVTNKTESTVYKDMKIEPYEDLSYFDEDVTVCAFIVEKYTLFTNLEETKTSKIRFDNVDYEYVRAGTAIFPIKDPRDHPDCDPDLIGHVDYSPGLAILPLKYKHRISLDCNNYKNELGIPYDYHLYIEHENKPAVRATKLECDFDDARPDKHLYKYNNGTDYFFFTKLQKFNAYCGVEITKTCTVPANLQLIKSPPRFINATNDDPARLSCPGGKWLIGGEYHRMEHESEPNCNLNDGNVPSFVVTLDSKEIELTNGNKIIGEVECFDKYDCKKNSKLDISVCSAGKSDCANVTITNDELKCDISEFELTVYYFNKKTNKTSMRSDTPKFQCNSTVGLYGNKETRFRIPPNSRITCKKSKAKQTEPYSQAELIGWTAGSAIGAGVLVIVISVLCWCSYMKRKRIRGNVMNAKEMWKRMSAEKQLMEAKNMFGSDVDLIDGLRSLETILECESEDPDLWDIILPFLRRLQAVAYSHAPDLERKFNRYCYLHARKIIDKHGWISPTPITRSNPSGFIRTCAVHLLALARRNDEEAQKMVLEGFKVLQLKNGVEQYPHCGLLWAVVTQQRIGVTALQEDLIDVLAILQTKLSPENDIPEDEQLSQFGSVQNQVAFAIGAADVCITRAAQDILHSQKSLLSSSLVQGMLYTTSGNNPAAFFNSIGKLTDFKKDWTPAQRYLFLERLIPSKSVLEQVIITWIYQRRFRDANHAERYFNSLPNRKDTEIREKKKRDLGKFEVKRKKLAEKEERERKAAEHKPQKGEKEIVVESEIYKEEMRKREEKRKEEEKAKAEASKSAKSDKSGTKTDTGKTNSGKESATPTGKTPVYLKNKINYELYVCKFEEEKGSLLDWLKGKVRKEESMKMEKWDGKNAENCDEFVGNFVESYNKEWNVARITACPFDETEQNKLRSILQLILSEKTLNGKRARIPAADVVDILHKVTTIFETEPVFIEDIPAGITVVGDIHGQLHDLSRVLNSHAIDDKPGYENGKFLFLGDIVDRGKQILECVLTLFILKILSPDRFFILRGNHEAIDTTIHYGTAKEIAKRYGKNTSKQIFYKMHETFSYMSMCAIVGGKIFCAHGGVSAGTMTRHELRLFRKPIPDYGTDQLLTDMLWADPTRATDGSYFNDSRSCTIYYGPKILESVLASLGCVAIIRAHQVLLRGYARVFPYCLSIFSASAQDMRMNLASVVRISENLQPTIVTLKPTPVFYHARYVKRKNELDTQKELRVKEHLPKGEIDSGGEKD